MKVHVKYKQLAEQTNLVSLFATLLNRNSFFLVYLSYPRTDGSFAVNDVPSGSYVVEVISPTYRFEPVRVDITSKGKMR